MIVQLRVTTIPEGKLESTDAEQWRGVRMTPKILRTLDALRVEGIPQAEQAAASHETLRLDTFTPELGLDLLTC